MITERPKSDLFRSNSDPVQAKGLTARWRVYSIGCKVLLFPPDGI
jgi:hypothetical protein